MGKLAFIVWLDCVVLYSRKLSLDSLNLRNKY